MLSHCFFTYANFLIHFYIKPTAFTTTVTRVTTWQIEIILKPFRTFDY